MSSSSMQAVYDQLSRHYREIALMEGVSELLGWDERTMLPPAGGPHRAEQMSLVAGLIHQRKTDPRLGEWLAQLSGSELAKDRYSDTGATIVELQREYQKEVRVPQRLVEALTRAAVVGQQVWTESRSADDFGRLAPHLREIIRLSRERADAIGHGGCRYDVLLDDYEPGARTEQVAGVLRDLASQLSPLVREIVDSRRQPPREVLGGHYPVEKQRQFGVQVAKKIGFDFQAGRLDETEHPFCTTLGPSDCRITTRYDTQRFSSAFFGILHEAGHGIYEQGLRSDQYGLPPGQAASLGIHESQSRLWENFVGRSLAFWQHLLPAACKQFPTALADVSLEEFFWSVNDVRPSLVRVEADELTYNLHIVIRFELEQQLIDGDLDVADLPAAWSQLYLDNLGVEPTCDAEGVLQDIHWSAALFGYFATYSLGNLYAAQLCAQAEKDLGGLAGPFVAGRFDGLLDWLRSHVHQAGRCRPADQLVADVCGAPLSSLPLIEYLRAKLRPLYGLD